MIPFVEAPAAPEPASKQTALLVVSALASAAIALTLAALAYAVAAAGARMLARRIVLALMAVLEAASGLPQLFSARRFIAVNGWPDHRVYHAVVQDAGIYNLAMALAFAIAITDPARNAAILQVAIFLFVVHAAAHLLRYFSATLGNEPYFPPRLELAAALPLLVLGAGLLLFYR